MADRSVKVALLATDVNFSRTFTKAAADAERLNVSTSKVSKGLKVLAGAFVVKELASGMTHAARAAGDFQSQILHLTTDAGELHKNIGMVSKGILDLAGKTGTSTKDLVNGMYYIESAGFHGADALNVLKNAAEGAKVGAADLTTVSDALTTALNAYHMPASAATSVTNELIATVSRGKTKLEDLSGALGTVLPAAATAHIGLDQVLGAMATLTAQGINAKLSGTYLRQTILQLENPTAKAAKEMEGLGLSAIDVSNNLGKRGLTGTMDLLTSSIEKKMGPSGVVFIESLKKASKSTADWQKILANLSPVQQTYVAALANMVGGTKSMQAALALTGEHADTFTQNVKAIGAAAKDTKNGVKDWDVIQKSFNQRLDESKGALEALKIRMGNELLPVLTQTAKGFGNVFGFFADHPAIATTALAISGVATALVLVNKAVKAYNVSKATGLLSLFTSSAAPKAAAVAVSAEGTAAAAAATENDVLALAYGGVGTAAAAATPEVAGMDAVVAASGDIGKAVSLGRVASAITGIGTAASIALPIVSALGATYAAYKIDMNEAKHGHGPNNGAAVAVGAGGGAVAAGPVQVQAWNAKILKDLGPAYQANPWTQSTAAIEGNKDALTGITAAAQKADPALQATVNAARALAVQSQQAAADAEAFRETLGKIGDTNISATEAMISYKDAVAAAAKALKDDGKGLDLNTAKGRANMQALDAIASSAHQVTQGMVDQKKSLKDMLPVIQQQHDDFVKAAMAMGDSKTQAEALAKQYGLVPKDVETQIKLLGAKRATLDAQILAANIDAIHDKTVTIRGVFINDTTGNVSVGRAPHRASGGPVYAGQLYQVNEHGVELFQPAMDGTIIPHGRYGNGGGVHFHIAVSGVVGDGHAVARRIENDLVQAMNRGGSPLAAKVKALAS